MEKTSLRRAIEHLSNAEDLEQLLSLGWSDNDATSLEGANASDSATASSPARATAENTNVKPTANSNAHSTASSSPLSSSALASEVAAHEINSPENESVLAKRESHTTSDSSSSSGKNEGKRNSWFSGFFKRFTGNYQANSSTAESKHNSQPNLQDTRVSDFDNKNSSTNSSKDASKERPDDSQIIDPKNVESWADLVHLKPEFKNTLSPLEREKGEENLRDHPQAKSFNFSNVQRTRYDSTQGGEANQSRAANRFNAQSTHTIYNSSRAASLDPEQAKKDFASSVLKTLDEVVDKLDEARTLETQIESSKIMPGINVPLPHTPVQSGAILDATFRDGRLQERDVDQAQTISSYQKLINESMAEYREKTQAQATSQASQDQASAHSQAKSQSQPQVKAELYQQSQHKLQAQSQSLAKSQAQFQAKYQDNAPDQALAHAQAHVQAQDKSSYDNAHAQDKSKAHAQANFSSKAKAQPNFEEQSQSFKPTQPKQPEHNPSDDEIVAISQGADGVYFTYQNRYENRRVKFSPFHGEDRWLDVKSSKPSDLSQKQAVEDELKLPPVLRKIVQRSLRQEQVDEAIELSIGAHGVFKEHIASFKYRHGQVEMAKHIGESLFVEPQVHLLEAGTGIGKTFAYLIPLALSQSKVLISTHLLSLQNQLLHDIPQVLGLLALKQRVSYAVLMGRSNYLCRLKVGMVIHDSALEHYFKTKAQHKAASPASPISSDSNQDYQANLNPLAEFELRRKSLLEQANACLGPNLSSAQLNDTQNQWLEKLRELYKIIDHQDNTSDVDLISTQLAGFKPPFWGEVPLLVQHVELPENLNFKWLKPLTIAEHQCECLNCPFSRRAIESRKNAAHAGYAGRVGHVGHADEFNDYLGCWYDWAYDTACASQIVVINHALLCSKLMPRGAIRTQAFRMQSQTETNAHGAARHEDYANASNVGNSVNVGSAENADYGNALDATGYYSEDELAVSSRATDDDSLISLDPLLAQRQALIIDEAHAFEEELINAYSDCLSEGSLWWLAQSLFESANSGTLLNSEHLRAAAQDIYALIKRLGNSYSFNPNTRQIDLTIPQMFTQLGVFDLFKSLHTHLERIIAEEKSNFGASRGGNRNYSLSDLSLQMRLLYSSLGNLLNLAGVSLYGGNASGANLSVVNASEVNTSRVNASGTNIYGTQISGIHDYGAKFVADDYGANAYGASNIPQPERAPAPLSELERMARYGYVAAFTVLAARTTLKPLHKRKASADAALSQGIAQEISSELNAELKVNRFKIELQPVNLSNLGSVFFKLLLNNNTRPLLTSATLQVAQSVDRSSATKSFKILREHLGLCEDFGVSDELVVEREFVSPFNYRERSLVWLNDPGFKEYPNNGNLSKVRESNFQCMLEVLQRIPGGILVLARSFDAIEDYARLFACYLPQRRVFKQPMGDTGALDEVLQNYKAAIAQGYPAVLIGTVSCSTGIDLPGSQVQTVVIDRLMFKNKDTLERQLQIYHGNRDNKFWYFNNLDLPTALVALKQATGRLIRTEQDWGVVIIASGIKYSYKDRVASMLEPMAQTSNKQEVLNFVQRMQSVDSYSSYAANAVGVASDEDDELF